MNDAEQEPTVDLGPAPAASTGEQRSPTLTRSHDPGDPVPPRADSAFDSRSERFEERGELGRGGMGRVADAFDHTLARRVAIKHMLSDSETALARFDREARITARLEHPGIVPLYQTGRNPDGTPYYVMRRVDGRPFDQLEHADLDARLAMVPNILSACDALAYAHAHSIIHRDIKPSNILVGSFGETLVIDWGLARSIGDDDDRADAEPRHGLTTAGSVAGTPGFMAPEQARGEPLDARVDVFALGATLFTTLAGALPYDAKGATEMVARAAANEPPDWNRMPAGVPEDLRAIVAKAMASDRAARYPDAGALAADLRRFVTGNLVAAHRYSGFEQLRRLIRRHRAVVIVAAASIALLIAGAWYAIGRVVDARDDAITQARSAELARERAAARADDLTIARARQLLETDPTLAMATLRPLASGARWQDVAPLVASARTRGVAWRLPISPGTWQLELSPDGLRAFTLGVDGVIRIHDLVRRTTNVVAELHRTIESSDSVFVELVDDTHLALFDASTLEIIELGSRSRRRVTIAAPASATDRFNGVLYWIDTEHAAWKLDLSTSSDAAAASRIVVDDKLSGLWISPDGAQLAVTGERATWLVERGGDPVAILPERVDAIAWDPDSTDLYTSTSKGSIRQLHVARSPTKITSDEIGTGFADQIVVHDRILVLHSTGLAMPRIPGRTWAAWPAVTIGRGGVAVAASRDGKIRIYDGARIHQLLSAFPAVDLLAGSSRSPYVATVVGADLLVWELDATVPRTAARRDESSQWERSAGPHHLLVTPHHGTSYWLDLLDGAHRDGPPIGDPRSAIALSPAMTRGVEIADDGTARAIRLGTIEYSVIGDRMQSAAFLDERRVALASVDGFVEVLDLDTKTTTRLAKAGAANATTLLLATSDFVLVGTKGGVTRVQVSTQETTSTALDWSHGLHFGADGRVWFADGKTLRCWELGGQVRSHVNLSSPIMMILAADERHLVIDTGAKGHIVDLVTGDIRPTIGLRTQSLAVPGQPLQLVTSASGRGTGLIAVPNEHGGAQIIDGVTGAWWQVGMPGSKGVTVRLSKDASVLYEQRESTIVVWPVALPKSPDATAAAIDNMTNATVGSDDGVRWP